MKALGSPFPTLGQRAKRMPAPSSSKARGVRMSTPRSLNYERIKEEVLRAVAMLPGDKKGLVQGTLPEQIVALMLIQLGYTFQAQTDEMGGRLRLGGGVVDFKVYAGATEIICRVQGDFWHSKPDRVLKDAVQWDRLHALHYRVVDFWESDIYENWVNGTIKRFIEEGILNAS